MKVTKRQLQKIISEAVQLLNEEPADYYRDYKAGTISYEQYQRLVKQYELKSGGASEFRRRRSADRNAPKIEVIKDAIKVKYSDFLDSILNQLEDGRSLSAKQNAIVRKILSRRPYNADASLF
ncbi:MAG: hypothetical protein CMA72_09625 [Euryarchaeota archaeon]|nr:hypothetical protein [Euryarchaeota archaeon]